jgi:hypothetical protein
MGHTTGIISYFGRITDGSVHPSLFEFDLLKRTAFALGAGGVLAIMFVQAVRSALRAAKPSPEEEERQFRHDVEILTGRRDIIR